MKRSGFLIFGVVTLCTATVFASGTAQADQWTDSGPVQGGTVATLPATSAFVSINAGEDFNAAVGDNGHVYTWGSNSHGRLGNNATTQSHTPIDISATGALSGVSVTSITTGPVAEHAIALGSNHHVYAWGENSDGQVGNGTTVDSGIPVDVSESGALTGITVVGAATGANHTLAVGSNGHVYAWGENGAGELGNNSTVASTVPVDISATGILSGISVREVSAGPGFSMAVSSNGHVYTWGLNVNGQLGDNSVTDSHVPIDVSASGALNGVSIAAISAGANHAMALSEAGDIYTWGNNSEGQLGDNSTTDSHVPVAVATSGVLAGIVLHAIAAGSGFSTAVGENGHTYTWGMNAGGELGDGTTTARLVPVDISANGGLSGVSIVAVDASLALDVGGKVYAWGLNAAGEIGDGSTVDSLVPTLSAHFVPTAVTFDGLPGSALTYTAESVTVTTPAHPAGVVSVQTTESVFGGTASTTFSASKTYANSFTYLSSPTPPPTTGTSTPNPGTPAPIDHLPVVSG